MALITLVYVSFATKIMSNEELRDILTKARENNKTLDVTGMLLYRDGFFIQALEGEEETVTELFNKIKTDPRHRNILQVYRENIKRQSFGDWSMGFNQLDDTVFEEIDGYTHFLSRPNADFFMNNPGYAKTLLHMFRHKISF